MADKLKVHLTWIKPSLAYLTACGRYARDTQRMVSLGQAKEDEVTCKTCRRVARLGELR